MSSMRRWRWIAVGTALLIAVVIALGFRDGKPKLIKTSTQPVARLFDGFAYAGEDLRSSTYHVNRFLPLRLQTRQLPSHFPSGHEYYFHRPAVEDHDSFRIAREVLAPRLREQGFQVMELANGDVLMGIVAIDGGDGGTTLWSIRFTRNNCSGEISHEFDHGIARNRWPVIHTTWEDADYIFAVKGNCGL